MVEGVLSDPHLAEVAAASVNNALTTRTANARSLPRARRKLVEVGALA
jgi:hypothetical protein